MSHSRGRAAHTGATLARVLLALLLGGAFAACGAPPLVAPTQGAVYVIGVSATGEESLVALRGSDGAVLWRTPIPRDSESGIASVTVTPSQVYVVAGGKPSSGDWSLMAVNADTGKVVWSFAPGPLIRSIQVRSAAIYVATQSGLYALRASDGRVFWQHDGDAVSLAFGQRGLFAAFSGITASANTVLALASDDGKLLWQQQLDASPEQLLYQQGGVYVTTATEMVALAERDGSALWKSQIAGASLVGVVDLNIYLTELQPPAVTLTNLQATTGQALWLQPLLGNWYGAPTITRTAVYAKFALNALCALHPSDGGTAWCYQGKQPVALVANDQVSYVSDTTGALCALRAGDGSHQWCQHQQASSAALAAARMFLTTPDGAVCALQAASGAQVWCQHVAQSVFDLSVNAFVAG